jgi:diguanylate cyclase (GGDEF)-like protein
VFQKKTKLITLDKKTLSVYAKVFEDNAWLVEVEDISTQEKENEDIYFRANYDQLTKLPNRELFNDRCKQVLSSASRHQDNVAIFFIDVDDFKCINDTYGHNTGDLILLETAKRLTASVRESDTVSRWAGDEFSILLPKIGQRENINQLLKRIIESFAMPQQVEEFSINVSLSIGISLAPKMGTNFDELMRFADKAMYEAKKNNKIDYKYYSE